MNWNSTQNSSGGPEPRRWLADTLEGSGSRSLERYLHDIEQELEHDLIEAALELSVMLPEMCSMLEHPQMRTSPSHCVCWCDAWVAADNNSRNVFPLTRIYLREENAELAQWISEDAQFARSVCQSLLDAARSWYQQRGAYDLTVQYNLGKICSS
jgi:hypothetical protein